MATVFISSCATAQTPAARGTVAAPYELSGTYTHVQTDGTFDTPLGVNGWTGSFSGRLLPFAQLTGEVGGYTRTALSLHSFLAGPQMKLRIWRIEPFVRALAGLSRVSGGALGRSAMNEFSIAAGGGIDVPATAHISVRALQCDYYRFMGGTLGQTDMLRIGIGLTYSFGD